MDADSNAEGVLKMKKSETLEDLFATINEVATGYDWSEEKPDSMFFIGCNDDHVMQKTIGHSARVAVALATVMLQDECVRDIISAAYNAYANEAARKAAPALAIDRAKFKCRLS